MSQTTTPVAVPTHETAESYASGAAAAYLADHGQPRFVDLFRQEVEQHVSEQLAAAGPARWDGTTIVCDVNPATAPGREELSAAFRAGLDHARHPDTIARILGDTTG